MLRISAEKWQPLHQAGMEAKKEVARLNGEVRFTEEAITKCNALFPLLFELSKDPILKLFLDHDVASHVTSVVYYANKLKQMTKEKKSVVDIAIIQGRVKRRLWTVLQGIESMRFWVEGETLPLVTTTLGDILKAGPQSELTRALDKEKEKKLQFMMTKAALTTPIEVHPETPGNLLLNHFRNSRKHGNASRGSLAAYLLENQLKIEVCDDGTGIEPDIVPRVFEERFTTHEEDDGKGLGLGLALADQRLAVMNATIVCHGHSGLPNSQGGQGARFIMTFPVTNQEVNAVTTTVA